MSQISKILIQTGDINFQDKKLVDFSRFVQLKSLFFDKTNNSG